MFFKGVKLKIHAVCSKIYFTVFVKSFSSQIDSLAKIELPNYTHHSVFSNCNEILGVT
jgi:hypothetical protein